MHSVTGGEYLGCQKGLKILEVFVGIWPFVCFLPGCYVISASGMELNPQEKYRTELKDILFF